jgi:hypothetical protein
LILMAGVILLAACDRAGSRRLQAGRLDASWTGSDSGRIAAPAAAEWCEDSLFLMIRAVQGDTGLGLALRFLDSITPDSYQVMEPSRADSSPPSASVALRLFAQTTVDGFQGDSGAVILKRAGGGPLSGSVSARARSVLNGKQIRLSGRFDRVAVIPQVRGCLPQPPDSADRADTVFGDADSVVD